MTEWYANILEHKKVPVAWHQNNALYLTASIKNERFGSKGGKYLVYDCSYPIAYRRQFRSLKSAKRIFDAINSEEDIKTLLR